MAVQRCDEEAPSAEGASSSRLFVAAPVAALPARRRLGPRLAVRLCCGPTVITPKIDQIADGRQRQAALCDHIEWCINNTLL